MVAEDLTLKYPEIVINYNWNPNKVNNTKTCPAGEKFLYINNKGSISPCSWVVTNSNKYMSSLSLKDKELDEVLKDNNILNFLEAKNNLEEGICLGKRNS
jgi:radical SAM protein with 4Fe4S-binding SPASM domain